MIPEGGGLAEALGGASALATGILLWRVGRIEKKLDGKHGELPERVAVCEQRLTHVEADVAEIRRR